MNKASFVFKIFQFAAAIAVLLLPACQKHDSAGADPNVDYYTCTMHPSVHSHDPNAKCPICSMDLVPVMKKGASGAAASTGGPMKTVEGVAVPHNSEFFVPVERQQQIGVTYAVVEKKALRRTIRSVGMVTPDKTRQWQFVARVEGYVQTLDVTSPGQLVEKDQPLLSIYSPDLLTTEHEFLNVLDMRDHASTADSKASANRLLAASRMRMEQWNVTPEQIADLEKSRKASQFLTLRSPFKGVVENVTAEQGRKVMTGDALVGVADLSLVWVWAEFYENEISALQPGLKVTLTANAYPGEDFEGTVTLVDPFLSTMQRTARARVDIPNPGFKLRPGMFMNLGLDMGAGEGLSIPVSAVMPTGETALVFVDKGEGKLEPRRVQLGGKFGEIYEVKSGLKEGERVVASANFLIDAESKVQGAVKSFEEPAMEGGEKTPPSATQSAPLPKEAGPLYQPVIAIYLSIKKQLAQDKLDGIAAQVAQLRERMQVVTKSNLKPAERADDYQKHVGAISAALEQFKSGTFEEARVSFGKVSAALIAVLNEFPPPLDGTVYVLNCPMWDKSPSGWIQTTGAVENPFMGMKMTGCGDVVKTIAVRK